MPYHKPYHSSYSSMSSYNYSSSRTSSVRSSKFDYHTITTPMLPKKYDRDLTMDSYNFNYKYRMKDVDLKKFDDEGVKNCSIPTKKQKTSEKEGKDNEEGRDVEKGKDLEEGKNRKRAEKSESEKKVDVDVPLGYPNGYSRCLIDDEQAEEEKKKREKEKAATKGKTTERDKKDEQPTERKKAACSSAKEDTKPALVISTKYLTGKETDNGKHRDQRTSRRSEDSVKEQTDTIKANDSKKVTTGIPKVDDGIRERLSIRDEAEILKEDNGNLSEDAKDEKDKQIEEKEGEERNEEKGLLKNEKEDGGCKDEEPLEKSEDEENEYDSEASSDASEVAVDTRKKKEVKEKHHAKAQATNSNGGTSLDNSDEDEADRAEVMKKRKKDGGKTKTHVQPGNEHDNKDTRKKEVPVTVNTPNGKKRNNSVSAKLTQKLKTIIENAKEGGKNENISSPTKELKNSESGYSSEVDIAKEESNDDSDSRSEKNNESEHEKEADKKATAECNEKAKIAPTTSNRQKERHVGPKISPPQHKHVLPENAKQRTKSPPGESTTPRPRSTITSKDTCPCSQSRTSDSDGENGTTAVQKSNHLINNHVVCCVCQQWYHYHCVNMSKNEVNKLKEHKISFTCLFCNATNLKHVEWIKNALSMIIIENNHDDVTLDHEDLEDSLECVDEAQICKAAEDSNLNENTDTVDKSKKNLNDQQDKDVGDIIAEDAEKDLDNSVSSPSSDDSVDHSEELQKGDDEDDDDENFLDLSSEEDYHNQILDKLISNLSSSTNLSPLKAKNIKANAMKETFIWDEFY